MAGSGAAPAPRALGGTGLTRSVVLGRVHV